MWTVYSNPLLGLFGTAEVFAEKRFFISETGPQGLKPILFFKHLARLKSCPVTRLHDGQILNRISASSEVVPCYKSIFETRSSFSTQFNLQQIHLLRRSIWHLLR